MSVVSMAHRDNCVNQRKVGVHQTRGRWSLTRLLELDYVINQLGQAAIRSALVALG